MSRTPEQREKENKLYIKRKQKQGLQSLSAYVPKEYLSEIRDLLSFITEHFNNMNIDNLKNHIVKLNANTLEKYLDHYFEAKGKKPKATTKPKLPKVALGPDESHCKYCEGTGWMTREQKQAYKAIQSAKGIMDKKRSETEDGFPYLPGVTDDPNDPQWGAPIDPHKNDLEDTESKFPVKGKTTTTHYDASAIRLGCWYHLVDRADSSRDLFLCYTSEGRCFCMGYQLTNGDVKMLVQNYTTSVGQQLAEITHLSKERFDQLLTQKADFKMIHGSYKLLGKGKQTFADFAGLPALNPDQAVPIF
jgi:hypothetical protein